MIREIYNLIANDEGITLYSEYKARKRAEFYARHKMLDFFRKYGLWVVLAALAIIAVR